MPIVEEITSAIVFVHVSVQWDPGSGQGANFNFEHFENEMLAMFWGLWVGNLHWT